MISDAELLAGLAFLQVHCDPVYVDALKVAENVVVDIHNRRRREELAGHPVDELTLSIRAQQRLADLDIVTIGQLCQRRAKDLLKRHAFGVLNLRQVREELGKRGLSLAGEEPVRT